MNDFLGKVNLVKSADHKSMKNFQTCKDFEAASLGLARLIEISVNRSIYKRKTIIDMKFQKSVTFNGCSVYLFN